MSKLSNILKMVILLNNRGKMKIQDLAEELEVSTRMIRRYKDELEQVSIYIDSFNGAKGGYVLKENPFPMLVKLDQHEIAALQMAKEHLSYEENFIFINEFNSAIDKINSIYTSKGHNMTVGSDEENKFIQYSYPNVDIEIEKKKYNDFHAAVISNRKIRINYTSIKSGNTERIVCPYAVFMYNGFWYFIGHCELRNEVRHFKLSRISSYEVLDDKRFIKPKNFRLKDYFENSIGLFNDKQYKLKLEIEHPMSVIVSERIWVENQKIQIKDDRTIIFEATMSGLPEIVWWILAMGSKVTIHEPEEIRSIIAEEIRKMNEKYDF